MSYDIELVNMHSKKRIQFDEKHDLAGGTYCCGGTTEAWLNVTYNYGSIFRQVFGESGIRTIYGMTAEASIPVLQKAIDQLGDDIHSDYWKATEGNVKQALKNLLALAELAPPESIWNGD